VSDIPSSGLPRCQWAVNVTRITAEGRIGTRCFLDRNHGQVHRGRGLTEVDDTISWSQGDKRQHMTTRGDYWAWLAL